MPAHGLRACRLSVIRIQPALARPWPAAMPLRRAQICHSLLAESEELEMNLPIRRAWLRGGAGMAGVAVVAAATLVAGSAAASADTTLKATYPVSGSTFLAAPGATLALGPGKLASTVDLDTG